MPLRRHVVDSSAALHQSMADHWLLEEEEYLKNATKVYTRFERSVLDSIHKSGGCQGDELLEQVRATFHHGLGIQWGEDQVRVFNAFVFSCLPLIYGAEWAENKARVLEEWNAQKECPYTVVSMARRNGKTFVTAGTVAALLICIPSIKLAIFSTCKRTSMMMMSAAVDMLDKAFEIGTHCNAQNFIQVAKNTETIIYEAYGTKRVLGCFPGSVRVRKIVSF